MKNLTKSLGIIALTAVFTFSMTACGGGDYVEPKVVFEETSGRLTIINIDSKYNGKYVLAADHTDYSGGMEEAIGGIKYGSYATFFAGDNFSFVDDGTGNFTRVDSGGKITDGEVILKVWKPNTKFVVSGKHDFYNYIGNDKNVGFWVFLFDKSTITVKDWENKTYKATGHVLGVNFTDGIGTADATDDISDY